MAFITQQIPLVLASGSPIRAQMLKRLGLQFSVAPSSVDEAKIKDGLINSDPELIALELAKAKAVSVSLQYPQHLTIGADQVCALGDTILSKPVTYERAAQQLRLLSGKTHQQHSAICVMRGAECLLHTVESASLTMRDLTDDDITAYIEEDEPLQACGSYTFEQMGKHLFAAIEGETDVILGMPTIPLLLTLYTHHALRMG